MEFQLAKDFILEKLKQELPPTLSYHSLHHVLDVYHSAEEICKAEQVGEHDTLLVLTAALFHDSGFTVRAKGHEQIGCDIAREYLPKFGYQEHDIDKICGMIMATKIPQTPYNHLEEILADSDLDYLGRDDFFTIGETLFEELKQIGFFLSEQDWNQLQIKFLESHHYFTKFAQEHRQTKKNIYLKKLKENI